jgi:uncharacterized protein (TIGR02145 family)
MLVLNTGCISESSQSDKENMTKENIVKALLGTYNGVEKSISTNKLSEVNKIINTHKGRSLTDIKETISEGIVQSINSLSTIQNYAENPNNNIPTVQSYLDIGIMNVNANTLKTINANITKSNAEDVNSVSKIKKIVNESILKVDNALMKINNYAKLKNPTKKEIPTLQTYADLGIDGVDINNLNALNAKIGVDIINDDTKMDNYAIKIIQNYAEDSEYNEAPSVDDYIDAGIIGVNISNIESVNLEIEKSNLIDISTFEKIQDVVSLGIIKLSHGLRKINKYSELTNPKQEQIPVVQDYLDIGLNNVNSSNLKAINIGIIESNKQGTNTIAKIKNIVERGDALANIALKIINDYNKGINSMEPTAEDYIYAGIENKNNVNIDNLREAAIFKIASYADNNLQNIPIIEDYINAGVTGVTIYNINKINKLIDSTTFTKVNSNEAIQKLVNSYIIPSPLPSNIKISKKDLEFVVASIRDTKYADIDIPAIFNTYSQENDNKYLIKIPYTVTDEDVSLPSYFMKSEIPSYCTEDDEKGVIVLFGWLEQQNLPVGKGTFDAYIWFFDDNGNQDNLFKAKKLNLDYDRKGLTATQISYPINNILGETGTFKLRIIPGVKDRRFGVTDENGDENHNFVYLPVRNNITGRTWLNNNLGSAYSSIDNSYIYGSKCYFDPKQQAKDMHDYCAYGSFFQWGRKSDGHELMTYYNSTVGKRIYEATTQTANNPDNNLFIINNDYSEPLNGDWRLNSTDRLWSAKYDKNKVCPIGYRLPTAGSTEEFEWNEEMISWKNGNSKEDITSIDAYNSNLKLPSAGYIRRDDSAYISVENYDSGNYWSANASAEPYSSYSIGIIFKEWDTVSMINFGRANGMNVRCIKKDF